MSNERTIDFESESDATRKDPHQSSRLYNSDLAPTSDKNWGRFSYVALWMSIIHNLAGYTMVAALFAASGLGFWQIVASFIAASVILTLCVNITGRMGEQTGAPFPVIARMSFGTRGAQIPALTRAVVAIMWYGIQTYLASQVIVVVVRRLYPNAGILHSEASFLGLSLIGWLCFLALWAFQLIILSLGMNVIRRFQVFSGPAIWVVMLALAVWLLVKAGGDISLNPPTAVHGWDMWRGMLGATSLAVGFWGTLVLNFSDFSRFSRNHQAMMDGTRIGVSINNIAFAVVAALATAAAFAVYGRMITDPGELALATDNTAVIVVTALVLITATMGVNVVANFVSPAYDLANLAPSKLTFRRGGLVAAVLALMVLPWKIYGNPDVVQYFIGGLGAILGPLFGVMAVDYVIIRRSRVNVPALYDGTPGSPYHYWRGFNLRAVAAFAPAAVVAIAVALYDGLATVAPYSWPIGTVLAGFIYFLLSRGKNDYPDVPGDDMRISGAGGDLG